MCALESEERFLVETGTEKISIKDVALRWQLLATI